MPPLRLCVHQGAVPGFEFGLEGVDTVMGLSALASANREGCRVMARGRGARQRGEQEFTGGKRKWR